MHGPEGQSNRRVAKECARLNARRQRNRQAKEEERKEIMRQPALAFIIVLVASQTKGEGGKKNHGYLE